MVEAEVVVVQWAVAVVVMVQLTIEVADAVEDIGPAGPQAGPSASGPLAAAAAEARAAAAAEPGQQIGAGMAGTYRPVRDGGAPGAGPARRRLIGKQNAYGHLAPGVANQLAIQDAAAAASADQLLNDATQRSLQDVNREHARSSAAASAAASLYPTGVPTQQDASSSAAAASSS